MSTDLSSCVPPDLFFDWLRQDDIDAYFEEIESPGFESPLRQARRTRLKVIKNCFNIKHKKKRSGRMLCKRKSLGGVTDSSF